MLLRHGENDPGDWISKTYTTVSETVIETFSLGDLRNYSGDLESFEVLSTSPYDSTYSLHYIGPDNAFTWTYPVTFTGPVYNRILNSNSGPSADTRFRFWWNVGSEFYDSVGVIFAATDVNNSYELRVNCPRGYLEIIKRDGGSEEIVAESKIDRSRLTAGEWHRVSCDFHVGGTTETNGELKGRVYDTSGTAIAEAIGNDSTYTSGQFGWVALREKSNKSIQMDYLTEIQ